MNSTNDVSERRLMSWRNVSKSRHYKRCDRQRFPTGANHPESARLRM